MDFTKLMTKEAQIRHAEANSYYEKELVKFRNLSDKNLVSSAKYYLTQMKEPWKHEFSKPTYDAVFWHLIVPELFRRIEEL